MQNSMQNSFRPHHLVSLKPAPVVITWKTLSVGKMERRWFGLTSHMDCQVVLSLSPVNCTLCINADGMTYDGGPSLDCKRISPAMGISLEWTGSDAEALAPRASIITSTSVTLVETLPHDTDTC